MDFIRGLIYKVKSKNKVLLTVLIIFLLLIIISILILINYNIIPRKGNIREINPAEYETMTLNDVGTARKVDLGELSEPKELGYPWNEQGTVILNSNGILVDMDKIPDKDFMELALDNNDDYKLIYFKSNKALFGQIVKADYKQGGLSLYIIKLKSEFRNFDKLFIEPVGGDSMYSIGHIIFKNLNPSFNLILLIVYSGLILILLIITLYFLIKVFSKHTVNSVDIREDKSRLFLIAVISSMIILFIFVFITNAWVAEDAYITFRAVDNLLEGYGLTWNVEDRVQVYTHPLWLFVMSIANFIIPNIFYASIIFSFMFCMITVFIVIFSISSYFNITYKKIIKIFLFILLLSSSKSFMDYTTSGLENPLSYLILVLFFTPIIFSEKKICDYSTKLNFFMFFIASLAFINRMDTVLLYIPVLVYILVMSIKQKRFRRTIGVAILGTIPAWFWLIFSTFYYGFPFPNTAYAKLNTGVNFIHLLIQGLIYFSDCLIFDTITIISIGFSVVIAFYKKEKKLIFASMGIILYLLYILKIGGDFMRGRFFALPFLLAVIIIIFSIKSIKVTFIIALIITIITMINPFSPIKTTEEFPTYLSSPIYRKIHPWGIADEKAYYFQGAGLLMCSKNPDLPSYRSRYEGELNNREVIIKSNIGYFGYFAGPECFMIDTFALSDPLLSRLPIKDLNNWRIGHFRRKIPQGYYRSILTLLNL